jgi:hypothetical protein
MVSSAIPDPTARAGEPRHHRRSHPRGGGGAGVRRSHRVAELHHRRGARHACRARTCTRAGSLPLRGWWLRVMGRDCGRSCAADAVAVSDEAFDAGISEPRCQASTVLRAVAGEAGHRGCCDADLAGCVGEILVGLWALKERVEGIPVSRSRRSARDSTARASPCPRLSSDSSLEQDPRPKKSRSSADVVVVRREEARRGFSVMRRCPPPRHRGGSYFTPEKSRWRKYSPMVGCVQSLEFPAGAGCNVSRPSRISFKAIFNVGIPAAS